LEFRVYRDDDFPWKFSQSYYFYFRLLGNGSYLLVESKYWDLGAATASWRSFNCPNFPLQATLEQLRGHHIDQMTPKPCRDSMPFPSERKVLSCIGCHRISGGPAESCQARILKNFFSKSHSTSLTLLISHFSFQTPTQNLNNTASFLKILESFWKAAKPWRFLLQLEYLDILQELQNLTR
jgi:hypothetical protein